MSEGKTARSTVAEVQERLRPGEQRAWALRALDDLFRSGRVPDPGPDGFLRGRLLTPAVWGPADGLARRIAGVYMPWLGKRFDRERSTGVNVLRSSARAPLKVLWPSYDAVRDDDGRIEVFSFRTTSGAGAVDPDLEVMRIDYGSEDNPSLVVRNILDELVQVDDGLYLGKVLYRRRARWRRVGFFTLEA